MYRVKQLTTQTVRHASNPAPTPQAQPVQTQPAQTRECTIAHAIVAGKSLFDTITMEDCNHFQLFENLEKELCLLLSADKNHPMILSLKENFKYMTLAQAKKFKSACDALPILFTELPVAVKNAEFIISRSHLFETEKEAEEFFTSRQVVEKERSCCAFLRQKLQEEFAVCREGFKPVLNLRIKGLMEQIENCARKLNELDKKIDPSKISIRVKQRLQEHVNSENSDLRGIAMAASAELEKYKESIIAGLTKNGANLNRKDLLEYLVGPKEFLFDYYGITYEPNASDRSYPFRYYGQPLGYRLGNSGPFALEDEMRLDIKTVGCYGGMKERIVKENVRTKPITPEVQEMNNKIKSFLEQFAASAPEARMGTPLYFDVCKMLFDYNNWADTGAAFENFSITKVDMAKDPVEIKGRLIVGAEGSEKILHFTCTTDDFIMLIAQQHTTTADRISTAEAIRRHTTKR